MKKNNALSVSIDKLKENGERQFQEIAWQFNDISYKLMYHIRRKSPNDLYETYRILLKESSFRAVGLVVLFSFRAQEVPRYIPILSGLTSRI